MVGEKRQGRALLLFAAPSRLCSSPPKPAGRRHCRYCCAGRATTLLQGAVRHRRQTDPPEMRTSGRAEAPARYDTTLLSGASDRHSCPAWLISRLSHAFARLQPRSTVWEDTCNAAAVSSTEGPPKNLISTTFALRASRLARAYNASSTSPSGRF